MSESFFVTDCPACKTPNLVCQGDTSDCTSTVGEDFRCWACKTACVLREDYDESGGDFYDDSDFVVAEDQDKSYFTEATPPPRWTAEQIASIKIKVAEIYQRWNVGVK